MSGFITKYEKSEQLFDYVTMAVSDAQTILKADGSTVSDLYWSVSDYIPCNGTTFTINPIGGGTPAICLYDENKQYITGKAYNTGSATTKRSVTITSATTAKFIRFAYYFQAAPEAAHDDLSQIMINEGLSTVTYQPYGNIWKDITPQQYINGEFVDNANIPEKYSGGSWG